MAEKGLTPASEALLADVANHKPLCDLYNYGNLPCTCGLAARLVEVEEQARAARPHDDVDHYRRDCPVCRDKAAAQLQAAEAQLVRLREALEEHAEAIADLIDAAGYLIEYEDTDGQRGTATTAQLRTALEKLSNP
jgi:hypothetical protein